MSGCLRAAADYLLQAWYRHRFKLQNDSALAGTFGIIDSTAYLDANEYANDEYTQFMNEAFVNAGNYNLSSYDAGVALEADFGTFSFDAVGMNINENDDGKTTTSGARRSVGTRNSSSAPATTASTSPARAASSPGRPPSSSRTPIRPRTHPGGRASPSRDCSLLCLMTSPSLAAVTLS